MFTSALVRSRGEGNEISFEMANVDVDLWKEIILDVSDQEFPSVLVGLEEVCLCNISLCVSISDYLSIYLSVRLSFCLFVFLSVSLSVCLYVYLSACLCIFAYVLACVFLSVCVFICCFVYRLLVIMS
jgi:hypothetical protein